MHRFLIEHANSPIRRLLMDTIDWDWHLIGITGGRGVGKTDFLLTRAKEIEEAYQTPGVCLYINLNNFFFTEHSIIELVDAFVANGGKFLFIDQVYKYDRWAEELVLCINRYANLYIVFAASPVMDIPSDYPQIAPLAQMYSLRGFSFREYLNLQAHTLFAPVSLTSILNDHEEITQSILEQVHPLDYLNDYLHHGYYPSYLEDTNFEDKLLEIVNMILDMDILLIKKIEVGRLIYLRKLLYIMMRQTPCPLNISQIASELGISRITTLNYLKYLKEGRLLNLLYLEEHYLQLKPLKAYMQNTNLAYMISTRVPKISDVEETFFYNTLHSCHRVRGTERNAMFVVDGTYYFDVRHNVLQTKPVRPCAIGEIEKGEGMNIPLWLFGFLY